MTNLLTVEQRDALQELMNIAMGQAANALAQLIDARIILSIPKIVSVAPEQLAQLLTERTVYLTRQSFAGAVRGEVLSLQAPSGVEAIAAQLDYALPLSASDTAATVLEVATLLAAACLKGFTGQLDLAARLSAPELYQRPATTLATGWGETLLLEVEFALTDTAFAARIIICMDPASVQVLIARLNMLLGD